MSIKINRLASFWLFSMVMVQVHANDEVMEFDVETLKARGLPSSVGEYFKIGKRFSPGSQRVDVVVNGFAVGNTLVIFDDAGQPCYDQALFKVAGINVPTAGISRSPSGCITDLQQLSSQASAQLLPGQNRIEFLVPGDVLVGPARYTDNYSTGGFAGIFNYDLLGLVVADETSSTSIMQGGTEVGVNGSDWILRSRQTFSVDSNSGNSLQHLYAYAQRSFNDNKKVFQGGELFAGGSLFSAPQIIGVQVFPEGALRNRNSNSAVMVSGIARSQARVEVRQVGVLIYTTLVPVGPFALSNLRLVTSNADLHVTVVEQNGASHDFVVPYASLVNSFVPREEGWSAALGKIRNQGGSDLDTDNLVTANGVTPLGKVANLSGGALLSENYRGVGFGLDGALPLAMSASGKLLGSSDSRSGTSGVQFSTSLSVPLAERLSLGLSQAQQTNGYRDITSVPSKPRGGSSQDRPAYQDGRYSSQYSLSLRFNDLKLGGFSLGYSRQSSYSSADTQRYIGSWSKGFSNKLVVSATVERDRGPQQETLAYVSLNIPFGDVRVGSNVQYGSHGTNVGVTADQQVNEYVGYNLSATTDSRDGDVGLAGTARLLPKYSSLSLGASRYGTSRSYSGTASGGMVLHAGGMSFSPYPIQDTFALVDVPGLSGARIDTPQGPVWTDWKGSAVAAYMPPYYEDRLELSTKHLPRNVDVQNALLVATPGRGSVGKHSFKVVTNRRVLMHVRDRAGQYISKGSGVVDRQGNYVATVGAEGTAFVSDESALKGALFVRGATKPLCQLHFDLPENAPEDELYEELDSSCLD